MVMIQDWGLMCDLLLDDDEEDALAEDQKTTLLQLLLASVSLRPTANEVQRNSRVCLRALYIVHTTRAEVAPDLC